MTSEEFLATQFASLSAWIRSIAATGDGSRTHERDGIVAQVSPALRDASLFNSVTYRDADALEAAMPGLESVYNEAGVRAWTVWIHEIVHRYVFERYALGERDNLATRFLDERGLTCGGGETIDGLGELPVKKIESFQDPAAGGFEAGDGRQEFGMSDLTLSFVQKAA